ncbi:hypothetical protein EVJ58_g3056 [Rhodofomes roseus]|uniref:Uncharacterized protein n=1 Tax=Rhodofomes roseus TaxID=34475 RepID=A0A4Y9YPI9_9APHY|nr:hypothetical protein EVJ58_g3056 [Rhodofomes roseus]
MKTTDGSKKRKPPTFRHLPENRAKKLKQSWVEAQKIKSQWKAQKRKEGIVTKSSQIEELVADHQDDAASDAADSDEEMLKEDRSASVSTDGEETSGEESGNIDGSADEAAERASLAPRPGHHSPRDNGRHVQKTPRPMFLPYEIYTDRLTLRIHCIRTSLAIHTAVGDPTYNERATRQRQGEGVGVDAAPRIFPNEAVDNPGAAVEVSLTCVYA